MRKWKKYAALITMMSLLACGKDSGALKTELVLPERKPLKPVDVQLCKDECCPYGTAFTMSRPNFQNLQENIINSEAYITELENLLKSLKFD